MIDDSFKDVTVYAVEHSAKEIDAKVTTPPFPNILAGAALVQVLGAEIPQGRYVSKGSDKVR